MIRHYADRTKQEYSRMSAVCPNAFWRERAGDASIVNRLHHPSERAAPAPADRIVVSPHTTIDAAPVIDGVFVETRNVVRHPGIDRSLAYVDGVDLAGLLSALPTEFAYSDIPRMWSGHIPPERSRRIASWLWERNVLVRAT
jgi:hypothetical protein